MKAHGYVLVGADLEEHHLAALEAGQGRGEPLHELGVDAAAGAQRGGAGREAPAEPGGEEGAGLLQLRPVPASGGYVDEPPATSRRSRMTYSARSSAQSG